MLKKYFFKPIVVNILFAMAILLLMGMEYFTNKSIRQWKENIYWVTHTQEVWLSTEHLLSLLKDAETGYNSFILMNERHYLKPYYEAHAQLPRAYAHFDRLLIKDTEHQASLNTIRALIDKKMALLKEGILPKKVHNATSDSTLKKKHSRRKNYHG